MAPGWGQMAAVNLIGSYNYSLVALSVFIAVFASYAALDLASRVTAAGGWTRALWVLGGACAMGTGICQCTAFAQGVALFAFEDLMRVEQR